MTTKAYQLGREHAAAHAAAVERHNTRPPDRCPFAKGSAEETEYDRGWKARMKEFEKPSADGTAG
jgi:hypothetical protein